MQFNGNSIFQDFVLTSNDGALDAAGEHRAGQGCPLCSIQIEFHSVHFVAIDKQDSFVGDDIIPGSPGGQRPVLVSSLGSDAAGQVLIRTSFLLNSIQRSRGQQSIVPVQLHLYAGFEGDVLQFNGNSILSNNSTINATA